MQENLTVKPRLGRLLLLLMLILLPFARHAAADAQAFSFGAAREARYDKILHEHIDPWFAQAKGDFTPGIPTLNQPVRLWYKAFLHEQARGNIVILHGFGERIEKYKETAFDFYHAGYNVFLYDQRGFGRSSRFQTDSAAIDVDSFDAYAVDLKMFLDQVVSASAGQLPTLIFAHSMGGGVATLFAHLYPQRVRALILTAPLLQVKFSFVPTRLIAAVATLVDMLGFGSSYAWGQKPPAPRSFSQAVTQSWPRWQAFDRFVRMPEQASTAVGGASFHWVREMLRAIEPLSSSNFAQSVTLPVLVLQAELETLVANAGQNTFCAAAPRCKRVLIKGSRHEIYREIDAVRVPYLQKILAFAQEQTQL